MTEPDSKPVVTDPPREFAWRCRGSRCQSSLGVTQIMVPGPLLPLTDSAYVIELTNRNLVSSRSRVLMAPRHWRCVGGRGENLEIGELSPKSLTG